MWWVVSGSWPGPAAKSDPEEDWHQEVQQRTGTEACRSRFRPQEHQTSPELLCESEASETLFCCCQSRGGGATPPHTCKRLACSTISMWQAVYEPGVFTTCRPAIEHFNYMFFLRLTVADTYCYCFIARQAGLITHWSGPGGERDTWHTHWYNTGPLYIQWMSIPTLLFYFGFHHSPSSPSLPPPSAASLSLHSCSGCSAVTWENNDSSCFGCMLTEELPLCCNLSFQTVLVPDWIPPWQWGLKWTSLHVDGVTCLQMHHTVTSGWLHNDGSVIIL